MTDGFENAAVAAAVAAAVVAAVVMTAADSTQNSADALAGPRLAAERNLIVADDYSDSSPAYFPPTTYCHCVPGLTAPAAFEVADAAAVAFVLGLATGLASDLASGPASCFVALLSVSGSEKVAAGIA